MSEERSGSQGRMASSENRTRSPRPLGVDKRGEPRFLRPLRYNRWLGLGVESLAAGAVFYGLYWLGVPALATWLVAEVAAIIHERVPRRAGDEAHYSPNLLNTENSQIIVDVGNTGGYGVGSSRPSEHNVEPSIEIGLPVYGAA